MSEAFLFPGQGSQKEGIGKDLYENFPKAKAIFEQANDILGERFSDFQFSATENVLMDTRYTQMGIFIYEVAAALGQNDIKPDCVAGHSLGEYAALVVSGVLSFEEAVPFIKKHGEVFYEAFQKHPSAMGAIIGIPEEQVLDVLKQVCDDCNVNLYADCILGLFSPESLDLEVLLDPFEEQLHLPPAFIKKSDVLSCKIEIVCVVNKAPLEFRGIVGNPSDDSWIFLLILLFCAPNALVFEDIVSPIQ